MHRHCPPQYNIALREHALPLRPRWVLYAVYENDFLETMDYEDWARSGLDWFAFHSGVWAGPAGVPGGTERWFRSNLRGLYSVYRMAIARCRRAEAPVRWQREIPSRVVQYVLEARAAAVAEGVGFLVVVVPLKPEGCSTTGSICPGSGHRAAFAFARGVSNPQCHRGLFAHPDAGMMAAVVAGVMSAALQPGTQGVAHAA